MHKTPLYPSRISLTAPQPYVNPRTTHKAGEPHGSRARPGARHPLQTPWHPHPDQAGFRPPHRAIQPVYRKLKVGTKILQKVESRKPKRESWNNWSKLPGFLCVRLVCQPSKVGTRSRTPSKSDSITTRESQILPLKIVPPKSES